VDPRDATKTTHLFRLACLVALLFAAVGCHDATAQRPVLPETVGGQPITYVERPVAEIGEQRGFFDAAVAAASGDPATATVSVGMTPTGFTITALRVPGADAHVLVEPLIANSGLNVVARRTGDMAGKRGVSVLTLSPPSLDQVYLYPAADTLVMITTSQQRLAEEAISGL
jgi:hypothetical protein